MGDLPIGENDPSGGGTRSTNGNIPGPSFFFLLQAGTSRGRTDNDLSWEVENKSLR